MKKILSALIIVVFSFTLSSCNRDEVSNTATTPTILSADDPVWGNQKAPHTMVVFSDFQCPFCAEFFLTLEKLEKDWVQAGKLKIQYRDFSLTSHVNSQPAHKAANAAAKQGKYLEMHRLIFSKQNEWERSANPEEMFSQYAGTIGLNMEQYQNDIGNKDLVTEMQADKEDGKIAGVKGTPAFFINGSYFDGALDLADLITVLNQEEAKLK